MTKRKIVDWAIVVNYDKDNCWVLLTQMILKLLQICQIVLVAQ